MAWIHVRILEVSPFHEPPNLAPAFGVRLSSGALWGARTVQKREKRQRTAALQDAGAPSAIPPRFMAPIDVLFLEVSPTHETLSPGPTSRMRRLPCPFGAATIEEPASGGGAR